MDAYRASNVAMVVAVAALAVAVVAGAMGNGVVFMAGFAAMLVAFVYAIFQWKYLAAGEKRLKARGRQGTGEVTASDPMRVRMATGGFGFLARPLIRSRVRVTLPGEDTYEANAYGTSRWPVGSVHPVYVSKRNGNRIYLEPS